MHMVEFIRSLRRDERGQDLIEYALLVSLIALVAVVAVTDAGTRVKDIFAAIVAKIPIN
jgi:pilus assembly protein Flp/PilA